MKCLLCVTLVAGCQGEGQLPNHLQDGVDCNPARGR